MDKYYNNFGEFLNVRFWDVTERIGEYDILSADTAKEIAEYIEQHRNKQFLIHCVAGMSRSAGVGMAIECVVLYGGNKYYYSLSGGDIQNHMRYHPNLVVYDKILEFAETKEKENICPNCGCDLNKNKPIKSSKSGLLCPYCFKEIGD